MSESNTLFHPRLQQRRRVGKMMAIVCGLLTIIGIVVLAVLLVSVFLLGSKWLRWDFLTTPPSQLMPENGGLESALWGTIWLISLTTLFTVPVGISAAIYLYEYAPKNRVTRFIELNISNLAGVPSIVYGILGMVIFIRWCSLGRSIMAGALTLSLLILPVVIIAGKEALAAVPDSFRQAAFGLGATRWQATWSHVLPAAWPGMLTGIILALSRAIGETAPLIVIGALTYVRFVPEGPMDEFTAMPIQIYNWCEQPDQVFQELAAAGIIVLLGMLIPMNAVAVALRAWHQRRKVW